MSKHLYQYYNSGDCRRTNYESYKNYEFSNLKVPPYEKNKTVRKQKENINSLFMSQQPESLSEYVKWKNSRPIHIDENTMRNFHKMRHENYMQSSLVNRLDSPQLHYEYNDTFRTSRQQRFEEEQRLKEYKNILEKECGSDKTNYVYLWQNQQPLVDKALLKKQHNPLEDNDDENDEYFEELKNKRGWQTINKYMNANKSPEKLEEIQNKKKEQNDVQDEENNQNLEKSGEQQISDNKIQNNSQKMELEKQEEEDQGNKTLPKSNHPQIIINKEEQDKKQTGKEKFLQLKQQFVKNILQSTINNNMYGGDPKSQDISYDTTSKNASHNYIDSNNQITGAPYLFQSFGAKNNQNVGSFGNLTPNNEENNSGQNRIYTQKKTEEFELYRYLQVQERITFQELESNVSEDCLSRKQKRCNSSRSRSVRDKRVQNIYTQIKPFNNSQLQNQLELKKLYQQHLQEQQDAIQYCDNVIRQQQQRNNKS